MRERTELREQFFAEVHRDPYEIALAKQFESEGEED